MRVTATEARKRLPRLMRAASTGRIVIIERHGKPVASLVSCEAMKAAAITPLSTIERAIRKLSGLRGVEKLVLFGSHARGEAHSNSDIDVMLVMSDASKYETVYRSVAWPLAKTKIGFEIVPVRLREWKKADHGVILSAKQEGKIIYERS